MTKADLIRAFAATVDASVHGLQSLVTLLREEQEALVGQDPEILTQVVKQKSDLLKQLEFSVQARDRLQQESGFEFGLAGGEKLVDLLQQPELATQWQQLVELGAAVSTLNDRNGQLVRERQRSTKSALEILTGRPSHDDTYRALRRPDAGMPYRTFGKG